MVGLHHQLNAHEFEQAVGISYGKRSLACQDHGVAELEMTEQVN